MRRLKLVALIAMLGLTLCGCQEIGEVENQAYVLVLAMDRTADGALTLTARVPKIGKSGGKGEAGDSPDSPYLTFAVTAPSWSRALDALQWATPRRINLSHIEMIVVSGELAAQPGFPMLMNEVADTPHLYTNARFIVCAGSAGAFLEAGDTVIGARLSAEIRAMLSQYAHQGFIPDVSLADVWYCANGIYGDPVAVWGDAAGDAFGEGDGFPVKESPMRQRFSGAALFRGGRFVRTLSARETRLLNLIRGQGNTLFYQWGDSIVELSCDLPVQLRVAFGDGGVTLSLALSLRAPAGCSDSDRALLEASITSDITRLVEGCQQIGCDPFGFAEAAAGLFPTVPEWNAFNWRARYVGATLTTEVNVCPSFSNP